MVDVLACHVLISVQLCGSSVNVCAKPEKLRPSCGTISIYIRFLPRHTNVPYVPFQLFCCGGWMSCPLKIQYCRQLNQFLLFRYEVFALVKILSPTLHVVSAIWR